MIQIQTKQNLWATFKTTVRSTQSPNLVSNSCYFPQVGLCEAPGFPGEALNLSVKFSKLLFLTVFFIFVLNLDLAACVALNRRKY